MTQVLPYEARFQNWSAFTIREAGLVDRQGLREPLRCGARAVQLILFIIKLVCAILLLPLCFRCFRNSLCTSFRESFRARAIAEVSEGVIRQSNGQNPAADQKSLNSFMSTHQTFKAIIEKSGYDLLKAVVVVEGVTYPVKTFWTALTSYLKIVDGSLTPDDQALLHQTASATLKALIKSLDGKEAKGEDTGALEDELVKKIRTTKNQTPLETLCPPAQAHFRTAIQRAEIRDFFQGCQTMDQLYNALIAERLGNQSFTFNILKRFPLIIGDTSYPVEICEDLPGILWGREEPFTSEQFEGLLGQAAQKLIADLGGTLSKDRISELFKGKTAEEQKAFLATLSESGAIYVRTAFIGKNYDTLLDALNSGLLDGAKFIYNEYANTVTIGEEIYPANLFMNIVLQNKMASPAGNSPEVAGKRAQLKATLIALGLDAGDASIQDLETTLFNHALKNPTTSSPFFAEQNYLKFAEQKLKELNNASDLKVTLQGDDIVVNGYYFHYAPSRQIPTNIADRVIVCRLEQMLFFLDTPVTTRETDPKKRIAALITELVRASHKFPLFSLENFISTIPDAGVQNALKQEALYVIPLENFLKEWSATPIRVEGNYEAILRGLSEQIDDRILQSPLKKQPLLQLAANNMPGYKQVKNAESFFYSISKRVMQQEAIALRQGQFMNQPIEIDYAANQIKIGSKYYPLSTFILSAGIQSMDTISDDLIHLLGEALYEERADKKTLEAPLRQYGEKTDPDRAKWSDRGNRLGRASSNQLDDAIIGVLAKKSAEERIAFIAVHTKSPLEQDAILKRVTFSQDTTLDHLSIETGDPAGMVFTDEKGEIRAHFNQKDMGLFSYASCLHYVDGGSFSKNDDLQNICHQIRIKTLQQWVAKLAGPEAGEDEQALLMQIKTLAGDRNLEEIKPLLEIDRPHLELIWEWLKKELPKIKTEQKRA